MDTLSLKINIIPLHGLAYSHSDIGQEQGKGVMLMAVLSEDRRRLNQRKAGSAGFFFVRITY